MADMERVFNTAGPCVPARHYMLPPLERLPTIRQLIDRGQYLVLHAPRQVGKTTALTALAQQLTAEGRYAAALVSMETGAPRSLIQNLARFLLSQVTGASSCTSDRYKHEFCVA